MSLARHLWVDGDPEAFRRSLEEAGFLRPCAPLATDVIVDHLDVFYATIRQPGALTITSDLGEAEAARRAARDGHADLDPA